MKDAMTESDDDNLYPKRKIDMFKKHILLINIKI